MSKNDKNMTDTEREKRNARRRKDPNRPLEWMMLFVLTMGDLLEVSSKQCQDCIGMFKYLAEHPLVGNRIQGAATWGKEKCMRTLGIRGKIAADCPLFHRENGDIICTAWPLEEVTQVLEERGFRKDAALARWGRGVHANACTEKEIEKEIEKEDKGAIVNNTASSSGVDCAAPPPCVTPPQAVEEVLAVMATECCSLTTAQQRECAQGFLDEYSARGWVDKRGQRVTDWRPAARKWARTWCDIENRKTAPNYGLHVNKRNEGTANEGLGADCPLPMVNYNPNTVPAGIDPDEYNKIDF